MAALSNRQFARQVNAEGASRSVRTGEEAPKTGVYVSTPNREQQYRNDVSPGAVGRHMQKLVNDRRGGYQGGWKEGKGSVYLDHSVRTTTLGLAVGLGRAYEQKAVYAPQRKSGQYIDTSPGSPEAEKIIKNVRVNGSRYTKANRPKLRKDI